MIRSNCRWDRMFFVNVIWSVNLMVNEKVV